MPYLPEDPAFSTGGWLIFKCRYFCTLVSSVRPDLKWDNVEVFKYFLVYATSWSNTKLFEFENWSTPGTKSGVFRYIKNVPQKNKKFSEKIKKFSPIKNFPIFP